MKYVLRKKPLLRWENWFDEEEKQFRGHRQEFTEEELLRLLESVGFKLEKVGGSYPSISFQGNALWIAYRTLEYFFYLFMKIIGRGTSKNIYAVVRK